MDVSLFDFDLPDDRIALRPASPRDSARMLVVRPDGQLEHRFVRDLPEYLAAGDALVVNDTKVIAARLYGRRIREAGPAKIEILLHRRLSPRRFSALARPARKLLPGDELEFGALQAWVVSRGEAGEVEIDFSAADAALDAAIAAEGTIPLPPYISGKRPTDMRDAGDYQTTYARIDGSVAAPTAGLHFTPELLARIRQIGIIHEAVTLHVGLGTFLPVTVENTAAHRMHAEIFRLDAGTASRLNGVRIMGRRIAAVGTTTLRALESAASLDGILSEHDGETDIFITPGYQFRAADMLLTNFHLPRSTLFMLVCAFMGLDVMKRAYTEAIESGYRFYSYGDACLLIPRS